MENNREKTFGGHSNTATLTTKATSTFVPRDAVAKVVKVEILTFAIHVSSTVLGE